MFALFSAAFAMAAQPIPTAAVDPAAYDIDATYDPVTRRFSAKALIQLHTVADVNELIFYLHGELTAQKVAIGGRELDCKQETVFYPLDYSFVGTQVRCPANAADLGRAVEIHYEGMFNPSIVRAPSEYYRGDEHGLYLRGWPAVAWYPVFLANGMEFPKAPPVHAVLRAPAEFTSIMAGRYIGRTIKDGMAADEWRAEGLTYYELQYTSRPYARFEAPGLVAFGLSDPESTAAGRKIADFAGEVVRRYQQAYRSEISGGETTYVLEEPKFGALASSNVFGITEEQWRQFTLDAPSANTLSHELVHPYVQMRTPTGDPMFALSVEGAPSYFNIPILSDLRGGRAYDDRLDEVQQKYLERRKPGYRDREGLLPLEKPLFSMTTKDVGNYKDRFVLADRALLFWDYMRRKMGRPAFDRWIKEITNAPVMRSTDFYKSIQSRAPALLADAKLWLETNDYPERFRRSVGN